MRDLDHSLPMLLLRAREASMLHFRPILNEYGLTEQQWRVLRVLMESNGLEAKELARRTLMLRPSMSGVSRRLERGGLIERRRDASDGRKICVRVTRRGRRLFERVAPRIEERYRVLEAVVSSRRMQELYASLERLIGACKAADRTAGSQ